MPTCSFLVDILPLILQIHNAFQVQIAAYIRDYRMEQAMRLLRELKLPISEITQQVGYETQGKFPQVFEGVVQILPKEYRRTYSSN